LRVLYVGDADNADKLQWEPCGIPNEVNFMAPFMRYIMPSLNALRFTEADFARLRMPVLIIHGRRDRSSPYGAGCDWAAALPNARLLTIDEAAHAPWIEAPERVFSEIEKLLSSTG
jgi:pimeloyl-ACP methyl ester carboxylesterase